MGNQTKNQSVYYSELAYALHASIVIQMVWKSRFAIIFYVADIRILHRSTECHIDV